MQSSVPSEKIGRNSRTIDREWHPKAHDVRPDNSKPKSKRNYSQARKLKEASRVFSF